MDVLLQHPADHYSIENFVGQEILLSDLGQLLKHARHSGGVLPGLLICGDRGMGKARLARTISTELERPLKVANPSLTLDLNHLTGILTHLERGDLLLIEEIDAMGADLVDVLVDAIRKEEFQVEITPQAKPLIPVEKFTLIGFTEDISEVDSQLQSLLKVCNLSAYQTWELSKIVEHRANLRGFQLDGAASDFLALQSDGTPANVILLLNKVIDEAELMNRHELDRNFVRDAIEVIGDPVSFLTSKQIANELITMGDRKFEELMVDMFEVLGFQVAHIGGPGDHGIDLIARGRDRSIAIQCKHWAEAVGEAVIRDFYGSIMADPGVEEGAVICSSSFSSDAIAFSKGKPIQLIDLALLVSFMREHTPDIFV